MWSEAGAGADEGAGACAGAGTAGSVRSRHALATVAYDAAAMEVWQAPACPPQDFPLAFFDKDDPSPGVFPSLNHAPAPCIRPCSPKLTFGTLFLQSSF